AIDPTTTVRGGAPERVAGRDAYRLILEPRMVRTLIGRIEIAVDAEHRMPLGVTVFARGAESAALSAAFSGVSFDAVQASIYRFAPPRGATVSNLALPATFGTSRVPGPP